jgi:hypothetical protein
MIMLIEGTPGKAYEPRGWELWAALAPLYESAEYAWPDPMRLVHLL